MSPTRRVEAPSAPLRTETGGGTVLSAMRKSGLLALTM